MDLADQYAGRDYAAFYPYQLEAHGRRTDGRVDEPHGIGFALLIAPAYAGGGAGAVEALMAAIAALGFVLSGLLARRLIPEPWATGGVVMVALSPPALAYSAAASPELSAGALLAFAAWCTLRVRESARMRHAYGAALALATLPWLGTQFAIAALPVVVVLVRSVARSRRRTAVMTVTEILIASVVVFATVNDVLFGGVVPSAAELPGRGPAAAGPLDYLHRAPRLAALWVDRDYGLLRWAPVLALAFLAAWLLWRSRREHLAAAIPARREPEIAAGLLLAVCAGQIVMAAFVAPTMFGAWFPGRHLIAALPCAAALTAWGLRHAPRTGAALGALTLVGSVWLWVALRTGSAGGWVAPDSAAPWGPAEGLLPVYRTDSSAWSDAVTAGALVAFALLVLREWRAWRSPRGYAELLDR